METTIISFKPVQYLTIAKKWKTLFADFYCESKFLHFLVDDYLVNFFSSYFKEKIGKVEQQLAMLDEQHLLLGKALKGLLLAIEMMVDGKVKENADYLENKQIKFEKEVELFFTTFSTLKKELYQVIQTASECHERFSLL